MVVAPGISRLPLPPGVCIRSGASIGADMTEKSSEEAARESANADEQRQRRQAAERRVVMQAAMAQDRRDKRHLDPSMSTGAALLTVLFVFVVAFGMLGLMMRYAQ